ncbi:MAG TPA: ABC-2 transporter permease [Candidatus Angelobacter sp.]|nr:ABC-2 transporter permease [Candidatus Angelobacter sp.]
MPTLNSRVIALVTKDLRENAKLARLFIGAYTACLILFGFLRGKNQTGNWIVSFVWVLTMAAVGNYMKFVIWQERVKRTLYFLKTLPIADDEIIFSKYLVMGVLVTATFHGPLWIAVAVLKIFRYPADVMPISVLLWYYLAGLVIALTGILTSVLLDSKLAVAMPFLLTLFLGAVFMAVYKLDLIPNILVILQSPYVQIGLLVLILAAVGLSFRVTCYYFSRRELADVLE